MKANLFFVPFLFSLTLLFGQTNEKVNSIRKTVELINKDTTYTKKILDNEQWMEHMTDGGGQLTGLLKNGHLVKIIEWVGLSSCISTSEFYLHNDSLVFVISKRKFSSITIVLIHLITIFRL
jgi:hypothetical protein